MSTYVAERPIEEEVVASEVEDFLAGRPSVLEALYREHFAKVLAAARRIVPEVEAGTVVHESFYRLLADAEMRATFRGGNLGAWLCRVATNQALDYWRRASREVELESAPPVPMGFADRVAAHDLVERFRREKLPPKWDRVFEARFLPQLGQAGAAERLGLRRSTLMYQEHRIRSLLKRFLLAEEAR